MAKVNFTVGRVEAYKCDTGKQQSFMWDSIAPGLGLRATNKGAKAYIFQSKLNGEAVRITIGSPSSWSLSSAQAEARRLKVMIDNGQDPRQVKADAIAAEKVSREAKATAAAEAQRNAARAAMTLETAWNAYMEARRKRWTEGHYEDHLRMASRGGEIKKRGKGVTTPGPLASLMPLPLSSLTAPTLSAWLQNEAAVRPTSAALAYRLLRAFAGWASDTPEYHGIIPDGTLTSRLVQEALPKPKTKNGDCLQKEHLPDWFKAIRQIANPVISTYLQGLLITGARRRELSSLLWADVDFRFGGSMTLRDKVEGVRTIPLTPYLANLLLELKRMNETPPNVEKLHGDSACTQKWKPSPWVFSSPRSFDGKLKEPRFAHKQALAKAGLPDVTIHGLRRSFGTLCEWVEVPSGVSAQIMGHKPSALAEKHYRRRPLDMLRVWHNKVEAWILSEADISFTQAPCILHAVAA